LEILLVQIPSTLVPRTNPARWEYTIYILEKTVIGHQIYEKRLKGVDLSPPPTNTSPMPGTGTDLNITPISCQVFSPRDLHFLGGVSPGPLLRPEESLSHDSKIENLRPGLGNRQQK
jgi:hypothetical protein